MPVKCLWSNIFFFCATISKCLCFFFLWIDIPAMYVNLTGVFDKVSTGKVSNKNAVRAAVYSRKFKVLTLAFLHNISSSNVSMELRGQRNGSDLSVSLCFVLIALAGVMITAFADKDQLFPQAV